MQALKFFIISFFIILAGFLFKTADSFIGFAQEESTLINIDTSSLAAANRVAKESSNFLYQLKTDLIGKLIEEKIIDSKENTPITKSGKTPTQLMEDLIANLDYQAKTQLKSSIDFGLHETKTDKNEINYKLNLKHSDFLANKFSNNDRKLASTLLTGKELQSLKPASIKSLNDFIQADKLLVSQDLIVTLVEGKQDAINYIKNNIRDLEISSDGLKFENLPNALVLDFSLKKVEADKEKITKLSRVSTAQLRIEEAEVEQTTTKTCHDLNNCTCHDLGTCTCHDLGNCTCHDLGTCTCKDLGTCQSPIINKLDISLNIININDRALYYDNSRAHDSANPVWIINKKQGGFSSVYVDEEQYINIRQGSIANKLGPNSKIVVNFDNKDSLQSFSTAVLESYDKKLPNNFKIGSHEKINIDILPRARQRFTTVTKAFSYEGITVPVGSVVVGTIKTGIHQRSPSLRDYASFRIFDQNSGQLIKIMSDDDLEPSGCKNSACFNMRAFDLAAGTSQEGAKVFTDFSSKDLFIGKNSTQANKLWANLQKALEANSVLNLYRGKQDWQKNITQDLKGEGKVLFTEVFEEFIRMKKLDAIKARRFIVDYFKFSLYDRNSADPYIRKLAELNENQISAFIEYGEVIGSIDGQDLNYKQKLKIFKNNFLKQRATFIDFLKNGKKENNKSQEHKKEEEKNNNKQVDNSKKENQNKSKKEEKKGKKKKKKKKKKGKKR